MPKLLAIDATANSCSVAASDGERVASHVRTEARAHARLLLPLTQQCLSDMEWMKTDVDAIVFGAGPGSFTGLRIAFGVAQGLAYGLSRPMIAVGSLECAAHQALSADPRLTQATIVMDARMGELYTATFERSSSGLRQLDADRLISREAEEFFADVPVEAGVLVALNIEPEHINPSLPVDLKVVFKTAPTAEDALRFVMHHWPQVKCTAADVSSLRYVRNAVATPSVHIKRS